jgi:hypothetical protein
MYRQCILQVVSEDEIVPNAKIADIGCRIVESEKRRLDSHKKEATLSGLLKNKFSATYNTASERMKNGDHYERLLFKPVSILFSLIVLIPCPPYEYSNLF